MTKSQKPDPSSIIKKHGFYAPVYTPTELKDLRFAGKGIESEIVLMRVLMRRFLLHPESGPEQPSRDLDVIGGAVTQLAALVQVQSTAQAKIDDSAEFDANINRALEELKKRKKMEAEEQARRWRAEHPELAGGGEGRTVGAEV